MPKGVYDRETDYSVCMNPTRECTDAGCIFHCGHLAQWCTDEERQAKASMTVTPKAAAATA